MENVNWGMVGVGNVTEVKSGPAFYKVPHSSLVAVMSRTFEKAVDYAQRHGVARVYRELDEMLADDAISIVYVATPPSTHKEFAIRAMRAGKHVYVEKPMALSGRDAEEMMQVANETGRRLFVAFYRRSLPYFEKVKALLEAGSIGRLLSVSVRLFQAPYQTDLDPAQHTWRIDKSIGGEGYFVDLAPHSMDMLDYLISPIEEVRGHAVNLAGHYDVADTVTAAWRHSNGILGNAVWCFSTAVESAQDEILLTGTEGHLLFGTFDFKPIELSSSAGRTFFDYARPEHIQQDLINAIVRELRGEGYCPSTGETALRTTRVIETILQS